MTMPGRERFRLSDGATSRAMALTLVGLASVTPACVRDDALGTTGYTSFEGSTGSPPGGSEDSGSSADSGDPPAVDECAFSPHDYGNYPMVAVDEGVLLLEDVCDFPQLVTNNPNDKDRLLIDDSPEGEDTEDFRIVIYRPSDGGSWPNEPPYPVVFFVPGNNQRLYHVEEPTDPASEHTPPASLDDHWYAPLIEPLVRRGMVVIAGNPRWLNMSSGKRMSMFACMMLWAQDSVNGWSEAGNDRVAGSAALLGHSRGGSGAWILTSVFEDLQGAMLGMGEYELCATAAIAQRFGPGATITPLADPTPTDITIADPDKAVPLLCVQGAADEDTIGHAISAWDSMMPEDLAMTFEPQSLNPHDKWLIWAYQALHNSFGGVEPGTSVADRVGKRVGSYYVGAFFRHVFFGSKSARDVLMVPMDPASDASSFPDEEPDLVDAILWQGAYQYADAGNRPLIYGSYQQGIAKPDTDRFVIDSLFRSSATTKTCNTSLSPATAGTQVQATTDPLYTCFGPADELTDTASLSWDRHRTHALRVDWGETIPGGYVEWSLRDADGMPIVDLSKYTHLSMRIGNLVEIANPAQSCAAENPEPFELRVELVTEGGIEPAILPAGVSVQQQSGLGVSVGECRANQYMRTVRWPLRRFCDEGTVATQNPIAIRVHFDHEQTLHRALIDSIELTADPSDPEDAACNSPSVDWNCIASSTLLAVETSCSGMPSTTGVCRSSEIQTNAVALPHVPGPGGGHTGWVVTTPAGWLSGSPSNPSSGDLLRIKDLCQAACTLEYSDNPHVTANCEDSGSLVTPTLRASAGLGAVQRIPLADRDGSGLFASQSLGCDLATTCSEGFDEHLAAARAIRSTSAQSQLERGEEYRVGLSGQDTKVTFITPGGSVSMPLLGEAGYSLCPETSAQVTCPFYLGSLALSGTSPVTIADTCPDQTTLSIDVTDLDIELVQPAFGIADASSIEKAFPTGALHLRGAITVDGHMWQIRSVNDEPVYLSAHYPTVPTFMGAIPTFFADDIDVELSVPCGSGTVPLIVRFSLQAQTLLEQAPIVHVTTPDTVSCPGWLPLSSSTWDADGDIESVRYLIGDTLIAPSVTQLWFNGPPRVVTGVVRDERGATWTHSKTVSCH